MNMWKCCVESASFGDGKMKFPARSRDTFFAANKFLRLNKSLIGTRKWEHLFLLRWTPPPKEWTRSDKRATKWATHLPSNAEKESS
jgi:hypothetical protein